MALLENVLDDVSEVSLEGATGAFLVDFVRETRQELGFFVQPRPDLTSGLT